RPDRAAALRPDPARAHGRERARACPGVHLAALRRAPARRARAPFSLRRAAPRHGLRVPRLPHRPGTSRPGRARLGDASRPVPPDDLLRADAALSVRLLAALSQPDPARGAARPARGARPDLRPEPERARRARPVS